MLSSVTLAESFVSSLRVKLFATAARVRMVAVCYVRHMEMFEQVCGGKTSRFYTDLLLYIHCWSV
jgi:uncharacterized protein YbcI